MSPAARAVVLVAPKGCTDPALGERIVANPALVRSSASFGRHADACFPCASYAAGFEHFRSGPEHADPALALRVRAAATARLRARGSLD